MEGYKLDSDDLMVRAKKLNGETIKGYGKLDMDKPNKLTPLIKD